VCVFHRLRDTARERVVKQMRDGPRARRHNHHNHTVSIETDGHPGLFATTSTSIQSSSMQHDE